MADDYIVSFKNGHKLKINVTSGKEFIDALMQGFTNSPNSIQQIYVENGIWITATDISAVYPARFDA